MLLALLAWQSIRAQAVEFETATEAVSNIKVGWNLFNTLESVADPEVDTWFHPEGWWSWETVWGNPVTKPELMRMIRRAGFNAMRVPVTWYPHMDSNDLVDPEWMKRVHDVVDYVIDQGMYCILNVHHDNNVWLRADMANYEQYHERFEYLWQQIAEEFKDYDDRLLFEGYNELLDAYGSWCYAGMNSPNYSATEAHASYEALNQYMQSFVNAVRSTGGNNEHRNLVVLTYCGAIGEPGGWSEHLMEPLTELRLPQDVTDGHLIVEVHAYYDTASLAAVKNNVDKTLNNLKTYLSPKGAPIIIGEWGASESEDLYYKYPENTIAFARYFVEKATAHGFATFHWTGPLCGGENRSIPVFECPEYATALLKGYYGEQYEPALLTMDDYDYSGIAVTYNYQWAELFLYNKTLSLSEYKGIHVELESADGIMVKVYGDADGKEQYCHMSSAEETFTFNKSALGSSVSRITLQNEKNGTNQARVINAWLIKNDGTEVAIDHNLFSALHGCSYEKLMSRKKFVYTVEYNDQWAEFYLYSDGVPLKLKNYKGIRVELAGVPAEDAFHIKVYGDGDTKEDYLPLTGTSTTILFNPDIFSSDVTRVSLQHKREGNDVAKVVCAYLIRQDGTEEYSDLSPFWGCRVTDVSDYNTNTSAFGNISAEAPISATRIFNLAGQRLAKPRKGINVVGGKKVVVK